MKPVREIIEMVRSIVPEGAFPGKGADGEACWPTDGFHVLVCTVLSQRTRDQNTFNASKRLFSRYNDPASLSKADLDEVMELVRPAGFPKAKAKAVIEIARSIHERFHDEVPRDLEALLTLPMVGRKTANCVLAYAFEIPAICVDTHVHRISNRIGLVRTDSPEETEHALVQVVPKDLWIDVNSLLVRFGQTTCLPRNPRCPVCPVSKHCDYCFTNFRSKQAR